MTRTDVSTMRSTEERSPAGDGITDRTSFRRRYHAVSSQEALDRFERQTAWAMLVLSLAIIPLLVIPLAVDLSPTTETVFFTIDWTIWGIFAVEYGIRLYLAPAKGRFVRSNVIDLVVVVIPFLRPLRVARSTRLLRLMAAARVGALLARGLKAVRVVLVRHNLGYSLLVVTLLTLGAGVAVWAVEADEPDRNIHNVADGLWWAITTLTTVGYGDRFPISPFGRGIAVVLMIVGVGVIGLLAASLASFFLERGGKVETSEDDGGLAEIGARLKRIENQLAEIRNEASSATLTGPMREGDDIA
jgi:voltage-gated potassium channel